MKILSVMFWWFFDQCGFMWYIIFF